MDTTTSSIAELIERSGASQERVAQLAGVDRSSLSRALRGRLGLSIDQLYRVRDAASALEAANRAAEAARRRVLRERGYGDAA